MSDQVQLALIAALTPILSAAVAALVLWLRLRAGEKTLKNQSEAVAVTLADKTDAAATVLKEKLAENTAMTADTRDIVNGQRDALVAEVAGLKTELAALKATLSRERAEK